MLHEDQPAGMSLYNQSKNHPALVSGPLPTLPAGWVVLGALSQVFGLSKAAGNWKGNLMHKNATGDGLGQKSITNSSCCCWIVFVFLFCRAEQGSQAGWAQMGCRYVLCESHSCQPWGQPRVLRAPQVCQHIPR